MNDWAALEPHRLGAGARKVYIALTRVAIPPGERLNAPIDPDDVIEKVGLALASMPIEARVATGLIVRSFNWLATLRFGLPFTSLSAKRQKKTHRPWKDRNYK